MIQEVEETKKLKSYLSFKLNQETFAMEVEKVIEILEVPKVTHVPKAPNYMRGVINLRGMVLPLIDTCIKFGLPPIKFETETCIIVVDINVKGEKVRIGALVDQVLEVLEQDENNLQNSPSIEARYNLNFIKGIYKVEEDFIMVLDLEKAFTIEEVSLVKDSDDAIETELEA